MIKIKPVNWAVTWKSPKDPKTILAALLIVFLFLSGIYFAWHTLSSQKSAQGENNVVVASPNAHQTQEKQGLEAAQQSEISAVCGNNVCEPTEGCATCPQDCACSQGMVCDHTHNVCVVEKQCGDGICQNGEENSCCIDCGCPEGQVCMNNTCEKTENVPEDLRPQYVSIITALVEKEYGVDASGCNVDLETVESAKTIGAEFDCPGSVILVEYDPESNTIIGAGIIPK